MRLRGESSREARRRRAAASAVAAAAGASAAVLLSPGAVCPANADEPAAKAAVTTATPVYQQKGAPIEKRVEDLLSRLTLEEKLGLLNGTGFATRAIPRLGVPAMEMADGPRGVRGGVRTTQGPATLFPSGPDMAATWDPALIEKLGEALGAETRGKGTGVDIILGPCVNIHRSPLHGRTDESFSEDPYLAARTAVAYIEGVQSQGTAACVKHFAANNEESDRMYVDVRVSERALHEIYLPAFEAAVKDAHVWSLMTSYNKVNGFHSSANKVLVTDILKKSWGFDGLVMSDWGGVHETAGTVNAGNDLEMPGGSWLKVPQLQEALAKGEIQTASVDDSCRRIIRTLIRTGLLDGPKKRDPKQVDSPAHRKLCYTVATEGAVLLKNDGDVLPLSKSVKSIAVIGPNAAVQRYGNGGSAFVVPTHADSPLAALTKRAGAGVKIHYAEGTPLSAGALPSIPATAFVDPDGKPGLRGEYFRGTTPGATAPSATRADAALDFDWRGAPIQGVPHTDFSVRWTGKLVAPRTGRYTLGLSTDDGSRLYWGDKLVIDNWGDHRPELKTFTVDLTAGQSYPIRVEYYQGRGDAIVRFGWQAPAEGPQEPFAEAVAAAKASDVAVVFAGASNEIEGEGHDRDDMHLPGEQDALIQAVVKANPKTVVVLNTGGPVLMGAWLDRVPAVIQGWYSGEEGASALAAVLYGDVNPSGKLPDTYAVRREDYPDFGNFPGKNGTVDYAEGIYVGYRHFDKDGIAPVFPFGHGLSYTTFEYGGLSVPATAPVAAPKAAVKISLRNTGQRAGAEVAQLYVHPLSPAQADRPVRELKGFQRVMLKPGESKTVTFTLDSRAFAWWDEASHGWRVDPGQYAVEVGSSSRDLRARGTITLK